MRVSRRAKQQVRGARAACQRQHERAATRAEAGSGIVNNAICPCASKILSRARDGEWRHLKYVSRQHRTGSVIVQLLRHAFLGEAPYDGRISPSSGAIRRNRAYLVALNRDIISAYKRELSVEIDKQTTAQRLAEFGKRGGRSGIEKQKWRGIDIKRNRKLAASGVSNLYYARKSQWAAWR